MLRHTRTPASFDFSSGISRVSGQSVRVRFVQIGNSPGSFCFPKGKSWGTASLVSRRFVHRGVTRRCKGSCIVRQLEQNLRQRLANASSFFVLLFAFQKGERAQWKLQKKTERPLPVDGVESDDLKPSPVNRVGGVCVWKTVSLCFLLLYTSLLHFCGRSNIIQSRHRL